MLWKCPSRLTYKEIKRSSGDDRTPAAEWLLLSVALAAAGDPLLPLEIASGNQGT
jgi:hypothetical protein